MEQLTADRLRSILHYEEGTGLFTRLVSTGPTVKVGDIAGCLRKDGYWHTRVDGKRYLTHRLVWLYIKGVWPEVFLDHKDGNRANNRIGNLRLATKNQNNQNATLKVNNTSGFKGVHFMKARQKWTAYVTTNSVRKYLGLFPDAESANAAVIHARTQLHGEFARAA